MDAIRQKCIIQRIAIALFPPGVIRRDAALRAGPTHSIVARSLEHHSARLQPREELEDAGSEFIRDATVEPSLADLAVICPELLQLQQGYLLIVGERQLRAWKQLVATDIEVGVVGDLRI